MASRNVELQRCIDATAGSINERKDCTSVSLTSCIVWLPLILAPHSDCWHHGVTRRRGFGRPCKSLSRCHWQFSDLRIVRLLPCQEVQGVWSTAPVEVDGSLTIIQCTKERPSCSACIQNSQACHYSGRITRTPLTRAWVRSPLQCCYC